MRLNFIILWLLLTLIGGLFDYVYCQKKIDIMGVVRDAESGEALPYANVTVKDTYRGAITNSDGYFVLVNEPIGTRSLVVRYIGYHPETVIVHNHPDSSHPEH